MTVASPPAPPTDHDDLVPTDEDEPSRWTTLRVLGLAVAVAVVAALAALVAADRLGRPSAGSVDVGFLQDMTYHHSQATEIAAVAAENASIPEVRAFAREVLIFQQYEVGYMEGLLEEWGYGTGDLDRTAMEWMDMRTTLEAMPGMVPDATVAAMRDLTGRAADEEFFRVMTEHHRGGIHMAEFAEKNAKDPRVRDLARRFRVHQTGEIVDYRRIAAQNGIAVP